MKRFAITIAIAMISVPCSADSLPKGAVPLTTSEIVGIYSGKTGIYRVTDEYYAPDFTTRGVWGKPKPRFAFSGRWSARGNEFCVTNRAKGDLRTFTDCDRYWRVGRKIFALWTVHYDRSQTDPTSGFRVKSFAALRQGDRVSARYRALGGW